MQLPEICLRRPVLATMMNLALVLFGAVALARLPVRELPDIDPPIVTVTTVYPGANAAVVETEITERIEDAVNGVEGIKKLTSQSAEQVSNITVEFDLSRDIDLAAQDVRDRVSRIRGQLPEDVQDPIVAKQQADARPVLWVAVFSDRYSPLELTDFAENTLKERLQTVPGVSSIITGGSKRFAVRIRLDAERMAAHGVTVLDVAAALREQNVQLPSGKVESLKRELSIETRGEFKSPEAFNELVLRQDANALVRLRDVGLAEIGAEDERTVARYRSQPAVGLGIIRQSKANTIAVADGVKRELALMAPLLPEGVQTFVAYDESVYVAKAIHEVWVTLGVAFLLVVLTIYLFLGSARSTLVPAITVPVSVIGVFAAMSLFGYSVNILTMLALVLAIGIVVDDSIVVLENVYRHIEAGKPPLEAAFIAMGEIKFAVIATTAALVAVFTPLAFQTSVTGRLFVEFAITLSGAVVISTFVALTLAPVVASRVLRKERPGERSDAFHRIHDRLLERIASGYARRLEWALDHRRWVLAAAAASVVLGGLFYSRLEHEFLPEEDKGRLFAMAIAPEGATAEYTDAMVKQMENIIKDVPEAAGWFSAVALSRGGPGAGNQGLMFVRFKEGAKRSTQDILAGPNGVGARLFREVEGALAFAIMPKAISGGFSQPFQMVIQYPDLPELSALSQRVVEALQKSGTLRNVRSQFTMTKPELRIAIERDRAAELGVSIADVSRTLQILFGGLDLSTIKREGKEYKVMVQLRRESRLTPDDLKRIYVRSRAGALIQLSAIVRTSEGAAPNAINRFKRLRAATIEATPFGVPIGTAAEKAESLVRGMLPDGARLEWDGEVADLREAGREGLWVVLLAVLITYMTLAAQFESLVHPLTVMTALPLGVVGSFGLLWALGRVDALGTMLYGWAHYAPNPPWIAGVLSALVPRIPSMTFNLFSMIGVVLLLGMVTKNSILIVEFANQLMGKGRGAREAVSEAARIRLRPILMTALSTVMGILPIAIGFGAGAEGRRPMGVTAVGGMISSTVLTLFVVPVVYVLFADWIKRWRRRGERA